MTLSLHFDNNRTIYKYTAIWITPYDSEQNILNCKGPNDMIMGPTVFR